MRKLIVVAAVSALVAMAAPAAAQVPAYPGTTTPTVTATVTVTQSEGVVRVGATATIESCGFAPNVPVIVALNGTTVTTATSAASGCTTQTVRVQGGGGTALGGSPRLAAMGLATRAASPRVVVAGRSVTAKVGTNVLTNSGRTAAGTERVVATRFTVPGGTSTARTTGLLPRTGAAVLRWSLAALALLAVGILLLAADRRHSRTFD